MATLAASVMGAGSSASMENNKTEAIYSLIRDKQYPDVIRILTTELQVTAHVTLKPLRKL